MMNDAADELTRRSQASHDLEVSEKRYRRLFEAAKDGILILDAGTGQIVDVNPFMTELTGYRREDFLGRHLWDIGPFIDVAASKAAFAELKVRKYVRYEDLPLKTRDGREIAVGFVSNVYSVDGQDVIQCNIRDISARKKAEGLLRESEREFRSLAEAMPQIVWITLPDGANIFFNQRWVDYTGLTLAESCGDGWLIRCRSQQIQQVLMNLLTNARDALNERYPTADPDKTIRIVASTFEKDGTDRVRLTVEDHGGGIPPEVAGRIFDPFYTTKGRDKGTGLGLSISHGIVKEHEGELSFETEPGVGTRFHVDLPVDRMQPVDPA